tara:strand:- start:59 stop:253 length:195 start_codon:yes stop_codon:yes gene_type:complete
LYRLLPDFGSGGRRGRGCREGAGEGLVHLKGLTNLQTLDLAFTKTTDVGIAELEKALPKCEVPE